MTIKQVQALLAAGTGSIDPYLSRMALAEAYRLPDDAVLVVYEDGGRLYESRTELQAMLNDLSNTRWAHPLADRLPPGQAFATDVPRLVAEFAEQADAPLDGSLQSLDAIDDLVRQRGAEFFLEPDNYPRLLAYVGEVLRSAVDGRWEMSSATDDKTWEPWIVGASGTRHPLFIELVNMLIEWDDESSSIGGLVDAELPITRRGPKRS